jgi:TPR repeat protein
MRAQIAVMAGLAWLPFAHASENDAATSFANGLAAYERGCDAEAAAHFRQAAASGDGRSAEILSLMYRFGPRLFPGGIPADAAEASKWADVAAEARRRAANAPVTTR